MQSPGNVAISAHARRPPGFVDTVGTVGMCRKLSLYNLGSGPQKKMEDIVAKRLVDLPINAVVADLQELVRDRFDELMSECVDVYMYIQMCVCIYIYLLYRTYVFNSVHI